MQDSHITYLKKAGGTRAISVIIKLILLGALLLYIAQELFYSQSLALQFKEVWLTLVAQGWSYLYVLLVVLMPLNWLLEAGKWQALLKPIAKISIMASLKGVLTGLSLGFMTPHSLGDYLGRIGQLDTMNRLESLGAILLGRAAQFMATLLFGLIGLWYWYQVDTSGVAVWCFWGTVISLAGLVASFLLARGHFVSLCSNLWPAAAKFVKVLQYYSWQETAEIFAWSMLRYATFSLQFFMLLYWLDVPLPAHTLWAGVTWVFLAKSVIPAFNFLSDLGVREFSALYFFGLFGVSPAPIITASLSIWLLNILIPTLIGSLFIIQMKIIKN